MNPRLPAFFLDRWSGRTSLNRLFWFDLMSVATVVNLLFGFVALLLLAKRVEGAWSLLVFALVQPYNLFLVSATWRHPRASPVVKGAAGLWVLTMLAI